MPEAKLPSGQTLKWKEADFPTVYANIMGFGMTPFDIAVMFGELGEASPTEVQGIPRVKVIIAPEQAANLMKLLTVAVTNYTAKNGPLRSAGAVNVDAINKHMEEQEVRVHIEGE